MSAGVCVAVAQDPGGAEALVPVLNGLAERGWRLSVLARRQACEVLTRAGVGYTACDEMGPRDPRQAIGFALQQLQEHHPQMVLTATSFESWWERGFIRAAYRRGIPRLTIVDAWSHYRARFLDLGETDWTEEAMPDRVTAVDEGSADDLHQAGIPRDRVRVVGQPALEAFVRWAQSEAARQARRRLRQLLDVPEEATLCVFFSQPISEMAASPGSPTDRGYDELQVLMLLQAALSDLARRVRLVVKPHPKEHPGKFAVPRRGAAAFVVSGAQGDELIMAADLVAGMASTALVKGALAGRRILSIQPGLRGVDPFVLSRRGGLRPVTDEAELPQAIRSVLDGAGPWSDPPSLPALWTDGQATQRVLEVVEELLRLRMRADVHPVASA